MLVLRSTLFSLGLLVLTPIIAVLMALCLPFSQNLSYRVARIWNLGMIAWLRITCGIRYRVVGAENIPSTPAIVMSKHQSSWETIFFVILFPRQVWVLKRELLRLPFFGWGLAMLGAIAIDRSAGQTALAQVEQQGRDRLGRGLWVVVFPEGTRVAPGQVRPYGSGGAWLATHTQTAVLPVAHNAGELWPRNSFLKYPGTITVSIGPVIHPDGMTPRELNERVRDWIETEMQRIDGTAAERPHA